MIDHQVVFLDRNLEGFSHIGTFDQALAGLDRHRKWPRLDGVRIAPRLPGTDVELPAMPRTAQKLLMTGEAVAARSVRLHQSDDLAAAQRSAGMRAAVRECKIFALEIENSDLAARDGHHLGCARRDLARSRDDLPAHSAYNAFALSRNTCARCCSLN